MSQQVSAAVDENGLLILRGPSLVQFGVVVSGEHIWLPITGRRRPYIGERGRFVTLTADYLQQNNSGVPCLPYRIPQHEPTRIRAGDRRQYHALEAAALIAGGVGNYS